MVLKVILGVAIVAFFVYEIITLVKAVKLQRAKKKESAPAAESSTPEDTDTNSNKEV